MRFCVNKKSITYIMLSLLICFSAIFSCTGCLGRILDPNALRRLDRSDLFTVAASSFIPVSPDGDWDEMYEIESDEYGRILFVYNMSNNNSSGYGSRYWAFVCHDSNNEYVSFYDDSFIELDSKNPSEAELNKLKAMNDWNTPLNKEKLSRTHITDKYVRYDTEIEPVICDLFESNNIEAVYSICTDKTGLSLYQYLEIVKNAEGGYKTIREYIVLRLLDGSFTYEEINTDKDYLKQITNFKQENNWDSRECTIIFKADVS